MLEIMERLLSPGGCPWDREQTHESLVRYLIEECYEVIEAIKAGDMNQLREELGDVLLQVVFHSALAAHKGDFTFDDVVRGVSDKMVARHPHVFSDLPLTTSDQVMQNWDRFKKKEGKKELLDGIPRQLPALLRAEKMQEKAARVGFDWPDATGALEKVQEEAVEFSQARNKTEMTGEMGDLLFALVNLARLKEIEPEQALQATSDKFARRISYIENKIRSQGLEWEDFSLEQLDQIWEEAKSRGL